MQTLAFMKLSDSAHAPTRATPHAAGFDLYSAQQVTVPAHGKALIFTDLKIAIPTGHYGRIAPRSGLTVTKFIDVGAGVIDEDYRGNVGIVLFNFSDQDFRVKVGDKIAQLICEKISYPTLMEVSNFDETVRNENGFGSSGL